MSRYNNRNIFTNDTEQYSNIARAKNIKFIQHYSSPVLRKITVKQRASLTREKRIWGQGDRLWKFAAEYYGDPSLWWVIAWYNEKPTDSHFEYGSTVLIPVPIEDVLALFGV